MALESCSTLNVVLDPNPVLYFKINKGYRTFFTYEMLNAFRYLSDELQTNELPNSYRLIPYTLLTFNNETETEE